MDLAQASKTIEWLDSERRKDRDLLTALQERVVAMETATDNLLPRIDKIESSVTELQAALTTRLDKLDEALNNQRIENARQFENLEARRTESEREAERLRQVEHEGMSRALAELRKSKDSVPRIQEELNARKEEEHRLIRMYAQLQQEVAETVKRSEERERIVTKVQESYRQDAKRVTDLQSDVSDLRRRSDESKAKLEVLEDLARRSDTRITELVSKETERHMAQTTWMEQQVVTYAERDRAWKEIQAKMEDAISASGDYAKQMEIYDQTHREMQKALDTYHENFERIDRRINEAAEVQRINEERFRQEWNAFLADDQKKWTTHMLLRDEQWREHERQFNKSLERTTATEEDIEEIQETLRNIAESDQARLQTLYNLARELLAEYDQSLTKVR